MLDWRWAERNRGSWNLAKYDTTYQANLAAGIRPIIQLLFAPDWTWDPSVTCVQGTQDCRYPPSAQSMDAFRGAVRKLVTRYPQMAALEIWNEPNLRHFWHSGPDPAHYAAMLAAARAEVDALGSPVKIIGAGVANHFKDTAEAMSMQRFLRGMYAAGAAHTLDGLSIHPYPNDFDLWAFFQALTYARDIRDAAGDDAPLWITETGIEVGSGFNENAQALIVGEMVKRLKTMGDVEAVVVHTLIEPSQERGFGVLRGDLTPRPAYCELARINRSGHTCPDAPAVVGEAAQELRWTAQDMVQAAADAARAYRRAHGSYAGLTAAELNRIDPRISPLGADVALMPGPAADPARVSPFVLGSGETETMVVCNTSQADRSYCILNGGGEWRYGMAEGNVGSAFNGVFYNTVWWW